PFINPGGLASFLAAPASNPNREPPLTPDGKINFSDAARAVSNGSFRLVPPPGGQIDSITQPINAANQLAQSVCGNNLPVLVGVNLTQQNGTVKAGHFVLVTGVDTDTNGIPSFTIADPGHQNGGKASFDNYGNIFAIYGTMMRAGRGSSGVAS